MTDRLTPEREAEIEQHLAATTNWSLGNLAARDLLAELAAVRAERDTAHAERDAARARVAELEEARRLEWMVQGTTPHTPRLCSCGHSHHAHAVPAPHACFAHGKTCPCEAYRQLPHKEALAQLDRNRRAVEGASQ